MTTPPISWIRLLPCLVPALLVVGLMARSAGKGRDSLVAVARMLLQLSLVGYAFVWLFGLSSAWPVVAILVAMTALAGWIALRPIVDLRRALWPFAVGALLVGPGVMLALVTQFVLDLERWYEPRVVVPLAGMMLANSMNSLSVGAERYGREIRAGRGPEEAEREAMNAGMIGAVNSLMAVGLVSFPGMMTGQILSGVSPLLAARYQIMVMSVLFGGSGMALFFLLRVGRPAFLRGERQSA